MGTGEQIVGALDWLPIALRLVGTSGRTANRYGGLGLMLDAPRLCLRWHPAQGSHHDVQPVCLAADGEVQRRVKLAHLHALSTLSKDSTYPLQPPVGTIEVVECPPLHSGLGVGTQLAAAVATLTAVAIQQALGIDTSPFIDGPAGLAQLSGRGKRSAIGLHGFQRGGLVRDLGYTSSTDMVTFDSSRPIATEHGLLPPDWMVVLLTASSSGDVHGPMEDQLINQAATQPNPAREEMLTLAAQVMLAAQNDDFSGFTGALDQYMDFASQLFENVQGGRYRDQRTAERVALFRSAGLQGVGQSSWGPTVFGFAPNLERAQTAADSLTQSIQSDSVKIIVARPKSSGVQLSMSTIPGMQNAS